MPGPPKFVRRAERYAMRPHQWNDEYRYDGGWAIIDTATGRQVGWFAYKDRCRETAGEKNNEHAAKGTSTASKRLDGTQAGSPGGPPRWRGAADSANAARPGKRPAGQAPAADDSAA